MERGLTIPPLLVAQKIVRNVGGITLVTLALCLSAICVQWLIAPLVQQHQDRRAGDLRTSQKAASAEGEDTGATTRLDAFNDRLADYEQRTVLLRKIFTEAELANIKLTQGSYTSTRDPDGGFQQMRIQLPIKGSYKQVRKYANSLLQTMPSLALNEISFQRDNANSSELDAQLTLTIYFKGM